jgi:hypothetical protein
VALACRYPRVESVGTPKSRLNRLQICVRAKIAPLYTDRLLGNDVGPRVSKQFMFPSKHDGAFRFVGCMRLPVARIVRSKKCQIVPRPEVKTISIRKESHSMNCCSNGPTWQSMKYQWVLVKVLYLEQDGMETGGAIRSCRRHGASVQKAERHGTPRHGAIDQKIN